MFGLRYIKSDPNTYLMLYQKGELNAWHSCSTST